MVKKKPKLPRAPIMLKTGCRHKTRRHELSRKKKHKRLEVWE